jgi:hypothetical protein
VGPEERRPGEPGAARGRRDPVVAQDRAHRGGADGVPQLEQLPRDPLRAPPGILPGRRTTSSTTASGSGGRPGPRRRPNAARFRRTSARCQPSRVSGRTGKTCHSGRGRQRLRAATIGRSPGRQRARSVCRRSTRTPCRSASSSASRALPAGRRTSNSSSSRRTSA